MAKWMIAAKKADFESISKKFGISQIAARLIRNRDVIGDEEIERYLNGTINDLNDGMLMKDMDRAVEILAEKIEQGCKIRIIGDYDIDGVNATYILWQGLSWLGADVDTDIPDRIKDGYGINRHLVDRAVMDEIDTVITCDNGIAAFDEIAYGVSEGLTVIVTDHHKVPFCEEDGVRRQILPPASAVVNPQREDCPYPFKGLCGAAVAYKLVEALCNVMGRDSEDMDYLMENVALATVGDVMDLQGENRIFVREGLEMLRRTGNPGLRALMECNEVSPGSLSAYHIGFVIGPCINAGGRLDTAKRALELLRATTRREAVAIASELKALNESRKEMTRQGIEEAVRMIEDTELKDDAVLVVYLPRCHESIAGIVAGRLRERYYRPVFVLTRGEDGAKGSGRSIEEYDMFAHMSRCGYLFTRFGGHRLAAGLSIPEENIPEFRRRINEEAGLSEEDLEEKVHIDMRLPFAYATEELAEELKVLEPFGKGNRRPLFVAPNVTVSNPAVLGQGRRVLRCTLTDEYGTTVSGVYFGDADLLLRRAERGERVHVTYIPEVNEYKGYRNVQLRIQDFA